MLACNSWNDDAGVVCEFVSQVRAACGALSANPFNVDAAERLLDLLVPLDVLVDEHGDSAH